MRIGLGCKPAGRDRVDGEIVGAEFDRERARQCGEPALRRRMRGSPPAAAKAAMRVTKISRPAAERLR